MFDESTLAVHVLRASRYEAGRNAAPVALLVSVILLGHIVKLFELLGAIMSAIDLAFCCVVVVCGVVAGREFSSCTVESLE